jgi:hypothetical protein
MTDSPRRKAKQFPRHWPESLRRHVEQELAGPLSFDWGDENRQVDANVHPNPQSEDLPNDP